MEHGILQHLIEAWQTNNRIDLFLVDKTSDAGIKCTMSTRSRRNVVRQFDVMRPQCRHYQSL